MERQQNNYHTVLETAHKSAKENNGRQTLPLWEIPRNKSHREGIASEIFQEKLGEFIVRNAATMNFFQFCRVLETLADGAEEKAVESMVRFRRVKSLSFPSGEIASVEYDAEAELPTVRTTFLGLYGVDAVLPDYFLNDIATHKDGSESLAAFLDIFNHRITTLFFQAWKKYRYPFLFQNEWQDDLSRSLLHLIGQGMVNGKFIHPLLDSRILGLFSVFYQRTRTKEGIISIVRYLLPFADVTVKEFQPQWVILEKNRELGKAGLRLDGGSASLGSRIKDHSHLIRIEITPDTFENAQLLLPKQTLHQKLLELLKLYLGCRFDASIYLNIKKQWIPQSRLAKKQMLGINTGLGTMHQDKQIKIANYTYSN